MESFLSALLPVIFYCIGSILGVVLIWASKKYAIPWLKQKIGVDAYNDLTKKIKDLMASAENNPDFAGVKTGEQKREWVIAQLKALGLKFDENHVRNLINGFTNQLTAQGVINTKK